MTTYTKELVELRTSAPPLSCHR